MELLVPALSIIIAVCYAKISCFDRLTDELEKIPAYTYSENMSIEAQIKIMMTAKTNCKKCKTVRISLYDYIKECSTRKDLVEEAKANVSKQDEKWCDLEGSQMKHCIFVKFNIFQSLMPKIK